MMQVVEQFKADGTLFRRRVLVRENGAEGVRILWRWPCFECGDLPAMQPGDGCEECDGKGARTHREFTPLAHLGDVRITEQLR